MAIKTDDRPGTDMRIRRTRQNLRDGFMKVASSTAGKVTVEDVAQAALVNRKTFYQHYTNLDDVMDDIEQKWIEELRGEFVTDASQDGLAKNLHAIYLLFEKNREGAETLLFDSRFKYFSQKFIDDVLSSDCFAPFYEKSPYPDMTRDFFKGIFFIYRDWDLKHRSELTVEALSEEAARLLTQGK